MRKEEIKNAIKHQESAQPIIKEKQIKTNKR